MNKRTTDKQIVEAIAVYYGVTPHEIVAHGREAPVVAARHAAVHFLHARGYQPGYLADYFHVDERAVRRMRAAARVSGELEEIIDAL